MATLDEIAVVYKALGDETRLRMINLLSQFGELCVCDLEGALEIPQSKTSRHLRILKQARLVDDRRDGAWVYYYIHNGLNKTDRETLSIVTQALGQIGSGKRDIARAKRIRRKCQ